MRSLLPYIERVVFSPLHKKLRSLFEPYILLQDSNRERARACVARPGRLLPSRILRGLRGRAMYAVLGHTRSSRRSIGNFASPLRLLGLVKGTSKKHTCHMTHFSTYACFPQSTSLSRSHSVCFHARQPWLRGYINQEHDFSDESIVVECIITNHLLVAPGPPTTMTSMQIFNGHRVFGKTHMCQKIKNILQKIASVFFRDRIFPLSLGGAGGANGSRCIFAINY